jgi:hypothetical protein
MIRSWSACSRRQVHNLDAVKQQLWLLEMETPCAVGDEVAAAGGGAALGRVTSYVDTPDSGCSLGQPLSLL